MPTYGIDLGTTYSCVAYIDETGRPAVAKNAVGDDTTPSVVYFERPDHVVVGGDAKASARLSPDLVVSLIKRQMGHDVERTFHGVRHTPESLSALILRELARAAGEHTGEEVRDVVITVPAYFGVSEREATRKAGAIAGLNVLNLVDEPVAAALHYGAVAAGEARTIMVYDLGGGTFDTTVIRVAPGEITVVCTDGDHHLGGADWDAKVVDHLLERFLAEHPASEAGESEEFLQELATAAEKLKKELSSTLTRRHNMRFAGDTSRVELTRETFEELTSELLDRTFTITERLRGRAAERGVHSFDDVLLVGGASRMPAVAAGLRKMGLEPRMHEPDLAVAKGAAQFALIESVKVHLPETAGAGAGAISERAAQEAADRLNISTDKVRALAGTRLTTVVPRAFGVKTVDVDGAGEEHEEITHVLRANTPLPARTDPAHFGTLHPDQTSIRVEVWEQSGAVESERLADNAHVAEGVIDGLPPLPRNSPIDVTFGMDTTGVLTVHAVELTTGKDLHIELRIRGGLSAEQVAEAKTAIARYTVTE